MSLDYDLQGGDGNDLNIIIVLTFSLFVAPLKSCTEQ